MTPFVDDPDFKLYVGDVREVMGDLPGGSVDCVVTSPPYWGLRDYGTGTWEGGEPDCDHAPPPQKVSASTTIGGGSTLAARENEKDRRTLYKQECGKCGARRVDAQIGLEPTPQEYVASIVEVFRLVRYVLADHGTVWLNLGDSYANDAKWGGSSGGKHVDALHGQTGIGRGKVTTGLKAKDLVGIPWRVAFALQDDGWYLRSDIIWSKPNPMPESITDRPTKAHEYIFLLSKQPRYYFDQEAVREPFETKHAPGRAVNETQHYGAGNGGNNGLSGQLADVKARLAAERYADQPTLDESLPPEAERGPDGRRVTTVVGREGSAQHRDGERWPAGGRNIRSVWEITTQPYAEAHFATFPEALPRRAIMAGCPEWVCRTCGEARERATETTETKEQRPSWSGEDNAHGVRGGNHKGRTGNWGSEKEVVGWKPCKCVTRLTTTSSSASSAPPTETSKTATGETTEVSFAPDATNSRPGVVLDPFMGSGTVALVARKLARHAVGVELNPEYAALCARRLQQLSLFAGGRGVSYRTAIVIAGVSAAVTVGAILYALGKTGWNE